MSPVDPKRWRYSPAFLIPLIVCGCGWLVAPPLLWSDTSTGLLAWRNFAEGGTWNTVVEPSSIDLTVNRESPITWCSPGQYLPLGLLGMAGLPLGAGMLFLALLSAASLASGLCRVARELGTPEAALPWIAVAATGSWHSLYAFGMFNGGEIGLIALFPWVILAGWRLRHRPIRSIVLLPPLLLIGSFVKHSFAIYALGLLAFLWLEALRNCPATLRARARVTLPLAIVGCIYALARAAVFTPGPSPSDPGQVARTFVESFGFSALAPLLAATGGGSFCGRLFMMAGLATESGWQTVAAPLVFFAPVALAIYLSLARGHRPITRLAGVFALTTTITLAVLIWRGGSISLDDRHFRPAGVLLLVVIAGATANISGRWRQRVARACILVIVAYGFGAALNRHLSMRQSVHPSIDHTSITDFPPSAQAELQRLDAAAAGTDGIIYLSKTELSVLTQHARLIVTDAVDRDVPWFVHQPRHGRVASITLVLPERFARDGRGAAVRASFVDYPTTAWTCQTVAGWDFWQARVSPSPAL